MSWRPIPIVAVTANATNSQSTECMDAGMTHFLSKPVIMQTLKKTLEDALSM
jgi:CheY-like chemotaxis protein